MTRTVSVGLAAALALLALSSGEARAGGWTQPPGGVYLKVWDRTLAGRSAVLADSSRADTGAVYQDHALNYYLEYGLAEGWTLVSMGRPFGWAKFGDESGVYIGDLRLGARRALLQGDVNLALEARYGYAPDVGSEALGSGVAGGVPFVYAPTVETHSVDGELQLGLGLGWGWYTASVGVRWMSADGLDPVVMVSTGLGHRFDCGLVLDGYLSLYQPLGDVVAVNVSGAGQTRFFGFSLDLGYWFAEHWALTFGVGGVAYAESNAATPALTLGFAYQ